MMVSDTRRSWVIISLTDQGQRLAKTIIEKFPVQLNPIHKPTAFSEQVQRLFTQGTGLIFICASGIVVRCLAPVLTDKKQDPPVLVVDEQGRFVIPLLSGHEGQANQWASRLAGLLQAQCVVTSAGLFTVSAYVAGMGCIRGCSQQVLQQLLFENLQRLQLEPDNLRAICSISVKEDEEGLIELAHALSVPFVVYDASQLRQVEDRLNNRSEYVFKEVGCYGVAESAALLHAEILSGKPMPLLMPKQKNSEATLAIAEIGNSLP